MKILIVISSILIPIIMLYLHQKSKKSQSVFKIIAVISAIIFGNIAATSIYQIIIDDTVFMTAIHGIFLNLYFLISGAYLGVFFIYRLLALIMEKR